MSSDLAAAWNAATERYAELESPAAKFNVSLLDALRPRWAEVVRPDTSMFTVLFTRPGTTGYLADEHVEVLVEDRDRVRMALVRDAPRRGETRPAGPVIVTGDYTRPGNALPAVEALLFQLADPSS